MRLAFINDHVEIMAELAKYTEPDEKVKSHDTWELVETELDRRWRKEGTRLLQKQQKQIQDQQKQIEELADFQEGVASCLLSWESKQKQVEEQQQKTEEQQRQLENQSKLLKLIAKAT